MSSNTSSDGLERKLSALGEKDIEIGEPLSSGASENDRCDSGKHISIWVIVNILATVAIVYINKSILSASSFSNCYFSFVAYHFIITGMILYIAGHSSVAIFTPVRISLVLMLPLSIITCANVILMNLALAHSSILFYQIVRILLTPFTAIMNLFFYGSKLPRNAVLALIPACAGVGMVFYSDALAQSSRHSHQPSFTMKQYSSFGMIFAFTGVLCSSLYTVWIAHCHSRLHLSSLQLLYNQAPFCAMLLSLLSIFTDTFPAWGEITFHQWGLLLLSGGCACMVHLSSFFIINAAGPVTSTVVAQIKTCLIVALGWIKSPNNVGMESVLGIFSALLGIMSYSFAMHRERAY